MDPHSTYRPSSDSTQKSDLDSLLDPQKIDAMPLDEVKAMLNQRNLDVQPSIDWWENKQNPQTRIIPPSNWTLRMAASVFLLALAVFLFARQYPTTQNPVAHAIKPIVEPPLGTLYLTVNEPVFKPVHLVSAESPREEYVIDEAAGPYPDLYSKALPFGQILEPDHTNQTTSTLEVIAFLDPQDPVSDELYGDLQTLTQHVRVLFVPITSTKAQGLLNTLNISSAPAIFINGYHILM